MYKYLLCWRYLRTRWIALASIISVTLGVATMIVVNSVMAGFATEMRRRINGILADVVIQAGSRDGFADPKMHMDVIRKAVGDKVVAMTPTVEVPGMLSFSWLGEWMTQDVVVVGIEPETMADVGEYATHLLDPRHRQQPSFELSPEGREYRRRRAAQERLRTSRTGPYAGEALAPGNRGGTLTPGFGHDALGQGEGKAASAASGRANANLPAAIPHPDAMPDDASLALDAEAGKADRPSEPSAGAGNFADPFASEPAGQQQEADPGDPESLRAVLGVLLASFRHVGPSGQARDEFMLRAGDDVRITIPTAGRPPRGVDARATLVDFFQSNMSEYDAKLVFVPLEALQRLRGMIDPKTGVGSVTSIQIKLRDYADAPEVVAKLKQAGFTPPIYGVFTWEQKQGPLLAAVSIESGILNVLLFLIIAVAGFGILAIFFMIVVEKTRDIGILKALGASSRGTMGIFLSYGLSLGIVGSGIGMLLGLLFVRYINEIEKLVSLITGHKVFDERIYYFPSIPTLINPFTVAWIVGGALLIAVSASILPARRAARLHPVQALRYE